MGHFRVAAFCLSLAVLVSGAVGVRADLPKTPDDLFRLDQIWSATVSFSAEEWGKLQPNVPDRGGFPGGPGGPGRPGGPGGGRGGFGPGNFLAGGFVASLDQDKDGTITQAEFTQGFARWFGEWDAQKKGSLTGDDIRDGINKTLSGPPPGGGPGPGPGGPGGGGPGFVLQGREGQRNGLSAARGIDFEYVHANLDFEGKSFKNVAVRYKGNGTFMDAGRTDKKSLKVELNKFVKGQKLAGESKLNFHNNITDVASMHEPVAYELYRAAGVPAPRTAYARVSLNVGGTQTNRLLGLYSLVENPDHTWAERNFGSKNGAIFKPVTRDLFKYQGTNWAQYHQAYDPKTELTPKQQQRVFDFSRLLTDADDTEFARRLPDFLEIDEFSRFMAVTVWLSSTDSILMMGQNFIIYLDPKTDRFQFVPWDLDRAFGNFFSPSPEELSIRKAWGDDNRFLDRVMKVAAVKDAYLARIQEFQGTLFQPARFAKLVDQVAARIRPVIQQEDVGKLKSFDQAVAGEMPDNSGDGGPGGGGGRGPFGMRAKPIKTFVKERHQFVADQLAGKSEGQPLGGGMPFGRGPGGPGGPGGRGPGGPGGAGNRMRAFGPGNFVGPAVFKAADTDTNGKVTEKEFTALADRWFLEWDKSKTGKLKQDDVVAGLNAVIPPPDVGPPPQ